MIKPAYIICSDLRIEDKPTNRLSLINVIEKVTIKVPPEEQEAEIPKSDRDAKPEIIIPTEMTVTSVWLVSEHDKGKRYVGKLAFIDSNEGEFFPFDLPEFLIESGGDAYLHRLRINLGGFPLIPTSGLWRIKVSVRPKEGDDTNWESHSYPFLFEGGDGYSELLKKTTTKVITAEAKI